VPVLLFSTTPIIVIVSSQLFTPVSVHREKPGGENQDNSKGGKERDIAAKSIEEEYVVA